jgi:GTPase SAR1 family protein
MPTIAVEFSSKLVTINNQVFKTQIWDTAGQETYRSLTMRSFFTDIVTIDA